jgi:putative endonuclease
VAGGPRRGRPGCCAPRATASFPAATARRPARSRRGRQIVFVEVKQRPDADAAIAAVTPKGRRRIARAAAVWVSQHPAAAAFDRRFDVVVALPRRLPRHLVAVFDDAGEIW